MHFIQHKTWRISWILFVTSFFYFVLRVINYILHKTHKKGFTTLKNPQFWSKIPQHFEFRANFEAGFIKNNLCKKVVFGVNCWKYFLIALITFRSSSDKFVSGHFAFYKLIAETLTFRASNLFLENSYFHDCSWILSMIVYNHWPNFEKYGHFGRFAHLVSPILSIRCVIVISSLSINLTRGMTHGRCTRWSKLICTLSNCRCAIWGTCSSCGRAVVRWICHACPTGLVLIILERFQKMVDFIKKYLSKKKWSQQQK